MTKIKTVCGYVYVARENSIDGWEGETLPCDTCNSECNGAENEPCRSCESIPNYTCRECAENGIQPDKCNWEPKTQQSLTRTGEQVLKELSEETKRFLINIISICNRYGVSHRWALKVTKKSIDDMLTDGVLLSRCIKSVIDMEQEAKHD